MFSIGKFFGHDEKFFDLLEASARQADSSVHQLVDLLGKLEHKDSTWPGSPPAGARTSGSRSS